VNINRGTVGIGRAPAFYGQILLRDLRLRWQQLRKLDQSRHRFGLAAAAAGNVKKIVATRLQKTPIAQATPRPLNDGFFASTSDPTPLPAVSPASNTGFTTPATSCSMSSAFCQANKT